jgi:adenine C2-methylase RlmN of 23S rRNA A2503 and tRNA A37
MPPRLIKNLPESELTAWLQAGGHAVFRLKQIRQWLYGRWVRKRHIYPIWRRGLRRGYAVL